MTLLGKLLRRGGVPLSRQEIAQRPWTMLQLLTETEGGRGARRLVLRAAEAGPFTPPRLELFQVSLASMTADHFVLRGIERVHSQGEAAAVVQELACKPMPELGPAGWLSPRAGEFSRDFATLLR